MNLKKLAQKLINKKIFNNQIIIRKLAKQKNGQRLEWQITQYICVNALVNTVTKFDSTNNIPNSILKFTVAKEDLDMQFFQLNEQNRYKIVYQEKDFNVTKFVYLGNIQNDSVIIQFYVE